LAFQASVWAFSSSAGEIEHSHNRAKAATATL
jgi:hypothetical protein